MQNRNVFDQPGKKEDVDRWGLYEIKDQLIKDFFSLGIFKLKTWHQTTCSSQFSSLTLVNIHHKAGFYWKNTSNCIRLPEIWFSEAFNFYFMEEKKRIQYSFPVEKKIPFSFLFFSADSCSTLSFIFAFFPGSGFIK